MKLIYAIAISILFLTENFNCLAVGNSRYSNFQISVFKDSSDTLNLDGIKNILETNRHSFIQIDSVQGPYTYSGTYWLYIQPVNVISDQEYVLTLNMWVALIEIYAYPFTSVSSCGGVKVPGYLKALSGCVVLLKPEVNGYLVKVQNRIWPKGLIKNCEIIPFQIFHKESEKRTLIQGIIQGLLWLMLIYNLVFYFLARKKMHLFYVIYIFLNSLFILFEFNYSELYIFPHSYGLNLVLWTFQLNGLFFQFMFVRMAFLGHCRTYTPSIDRRVFLPFAYSLLFINLVGGTTIFFRIDIFTIVSGITNLVFSIISICMYIYYFRGTDWFLKIIMAGGLVLCLFGYASLIYIRFYKPSENMFYETGIVIELLIFTYALSRLHFREKYIIEMDKLNISKALEDKNRELVYQAMQLSAKEEAITAIKEKIKEHGLTGKTSDFILSEPEFNSASNNGMWNDFEVHFNETHPNFYKTLMDKFPDLTPSEIRLCAFLKLNLNTKEIASITRKTARSIEVMRSRIRQKMNLERDDNLNLILSQLLQKV